MRFKTQKETALPSTPLRHRRGRGFFGLTGHNCDGILRIEEAFVLLGYRLKTGSRGSGAFDSAQAPPRAWVLRVDISRVRRYSANGKGVSAVGLTIKNRLTWLRWLSGADDG